MFYGAMAKITVMKFVMLKALGDYLNINLLQFAGSGSDYDYSGAGGSESSGLGKILKNARDSIGNVGSIAMTCLGVIMIVVGAFKIAKALMNHGKEQTSWVVNILLIVIGGVLLVSGLGFFTRMSKEAQQTINSWNK